MIQRFSRILGLGIIGTALAAGSAAPVLANEATTATIDRVQSQAYPGEAFSQYYYGRSYGYRRGYGGGAVAAGVLGGLAVGALAAGAIANSQPGYYGAPGYGPGTPVGNVYGHDPDWVAYCASKYRSFDPSSGTYLARDGNRYVCQ